MSDQHQAQDAAPSQTSEQTQRIGLDALATAVGSAAQQWAQKTQTDAITTAAFTVMWAALPETAQLRPERVLTALSAVLRDQPLEFQQQVGSFINGLIKMSHDMTGVLAKMEADFRARQEKDGNAGAKPN